MLGLWLSPHPGCPQPKQAPTGNEPVLAMFCSCANSRHMAWICTVTQHWKASHSDSSDTQSVWFLLLATPSSSLTMPVHRVATRALCFLQPRLPYWFWVCTTTWLGNKNFSRFIIAGTSGARGLWFYTTKKPGQRKPELTKPLSANKGTAPIVWIATHRENPTFTAVYITSSCMLGAFPRSSRWLGIDRKTFKEKAVLLACPPSLLAGECGYPVATGATILYWHQTPTCLVLQCELKNGSSMNIL